MTAAVEVGAVRGGGTGTTPTRPWTGPEVGGRGPDDGDAVVPALGDADGVVGLDPDDGGLDDHGGDAVAGLSLDMPKGVDMARGIVGLGNSDGNRIGGGDDDASLGTP